MAAFGGGSMPQSNSSSGFGGGGMASSSQGFTMPPLYGPQNDILSQLLGRSGLIGSGPDIQGMINQGINSPLLQSVLNPQLAIQNRQFDNQRQGLTDAARAAGGSRSGAYMNALANQSTDQGLLQGNLISQLTSAMLQPLLQSQLRAYEMPIDAYTRLFSAFPGAQRNMVQNSSSSGWENMSPSMGLQTPMTPSTPPSPPSGNWGLLSPGLTSPYPNAPTAQPPPPQYINPFDWANIQQPAAAPTIPHSYSAINPWENWDQNIS